MADAGGKGRREPGKLSFGGGEFWKPGVAEAPRHEARRLLLECVDEVEPLVLVDLREHVLPLYLNWNGKPALHKVVLPERTGPTTGKALARKPSFPAWFVSWIGCYHLDTAWVRETALLTLARWKEGESCTTWHLPPLPRPTEEIPALFHCTYKALPLTGTTLAELSRAIDAEYLLRKKAFLKQIEAQYREAGYLPVPRKHTRTARDHFLWLAEYQIGRMSYEKIQKRWEKNSTPQMVERAVKRLAVFLDLPLRPRSTREIDWLTVSFPPYRERQEGWNRG